MNGNPQPASPDPFWLEGGPVGVLLIHGFTGSPAEMRPMAAYLHQHGYTVHAPLLPGHGTTPDDLNERQWQEWTNAAQGHLDEIRAKCETVFVGGLSMGALVALYLGAHHDDLAGVIAYSPAIRVPDKRKYILPILKRLTAHKKKGPDSFVDRESRQFHWAYDVTPLKAAGEVLKFAAVMRGAFLPEITVPLLAIQSTIDPVIDKRSVEMVLDGVSSSYKDALILHNSGHVITLDHEWQVVAQKTLAFIQQHTP
jgi:carboxylesterase